MNPIKITISLLFFFLIEVVCGQTYPINDEGFKQCLTDNYATVVNPDGELILSEAAILESLNCSGKGIASSDGLQFFTHLKILDLRNNKLTLIDELTDLTFIEEVFLQENELVLLPDLSQANELHYLRADRNFLSSIPLLPTNSKLKWLDLNQNNLSSFTNLLNQHELEFLNLSRNTNLKEIPSLAGLDKLKTLHCYLCGLQVFPDISSLDSLEFLNIGYNNFTTLPEMSVNVKLKTVYANDNNLTSFPDLSSLPLLEKARLYNNYLSFEDFIPLLEITEYSEIYKIIPQERFPNPLKNTYFEFDSISFNTGLSEGVPNTFYTWFFNGDTLNNSNSDDFTIDSAQTSNSGTYHFTITHPSFPDLILESNTQVTTVKSCLNPEGFRFEVNGATCQQAGSLSITSFDQPQQNISYLLKSTATDRVFETSQSQFTNLSNPEYQLYAKVGDRCIKLINEKIEMPIEKCKEAFFTPNNDGIDDNYYFEQSGEARIYNKWGQLIQTLQIPTEWNGELLNSEIIAPGYYTIDINDGEEIFHLSVVY